MPITYVTGDATRPQTDKPAIIAHICNDVGAWGKGFVLALSQQWPSSQRQYRTWAQDPHPAREPFELGRTQFVPVQSQPTIWVANMIAQHGLYTQRGIPPIRYHALTACLTQVATFANTHHASVHLPRIGCGLAGGKWEYIEFEIIRTLIDKTISVTVYDFHASPGPHV